MTKKQLTFVKVDESRFGIDAESPEVVKLLDSTFSGRPEGIQHHPLVRQRVWNGVVHHIDWKTRTAPIGLFPKICSFAVRQSEWDVVIDPEIWPVREKYTREDIREHFESLPLPEWIDKVDDYQIEAVHVSMNNKKMTIESPTSSGKSLIIYGIISLADVKTLIVVPTTTLVSQMKADFIEYGCDPSIIAEITAGQDKAPSEQIVISTWHSIFRCAPEIFENYRAFIGDEAHGADTKSILQISKSLVNAEYRIGTTGTLPDCKVSRTTIIGIFGPIFKTISTREMLDRGRATEPEITVHVLKHNKPMSKDGRMTYPDEIDYLLTYQPRTDYIVDLITGLSESGNVVVFTRYVDKQGAPLAASLIKLLGEDRVRFFHSGTKRKTREAWRKEAETRSDLILIASYALFGTGTNIKNLHSMVFAHPLLDKKKILQAIGRGIRLHESKTTFPIHDIADSVYRAKSATNHGFTHALARVDVYRRERFNFSIYEHDLGPYQKPSAPTSEVGLSDENFGGP